MNAPNAIDLRRATDRLDVIASGDRKDDGTLSTREAIALLARIHQLEEQNESLRAGVEDDF